MRQVKIPFADPRRSYTSSFERYALELSRRITIRDVARHLGVGWDVIKDIQKRDLSRRSAKPKLKHLRHLALDEIAVAKGHRYLTVVMDLESEGHSPRVPVACMMSYIQSSGYYGHLEAGGPSRRPSRSRPTRLQDDEALRPHEG